MKRIKKAAFQGDMMLMKVNKLPRGVTPEATVILAHSETGHHHVLDAAPGTFEVFRADPTTMYVSLTEPGKIIHKRDFDTHEPIELDKGIWKVRRQREWAPEGWQVVAD